MAKITRAAQKIFGNLVGATGNFGKFGSLAAGTPQYSKDPKEIQSLSAWDLGWAAATVGTKSPALEDMNSLFYLAFRQLAYLLQTGMPEYDAETPYFLNSQCQVAGVEYISLQDNNTGNDPTTATNFWRLKASLYLETLYPVNEVYMTHRAGDPSTLLGFGTWELIGQDTFMAIAGPLNGGINATGGQRSTTLGAGHLPKHKHDITHLISNNAYGPGGTVGTGVAQAGTSAAAYQNSGWGTNDAGSDTPTPIPTVPPYTVLWYAWLRTA